MLLLNFFHFPQLKIKIRRNVITDSITNSHSVPLERIVCYSHTFENDLGLKRKFTKYLKESDFSC